MKFKVGDVVRITNPDREYHNWKNVIWKVARIVKIRNGLYVVRFFAEPKGVMNGEYGTIYNKDELELIPEDEALPYLI